MSEPSEHTGDPLARTLPASASVTQSDAGETAAPPRDDSGRFPDDEFDRLEGDAMRASLADKMFGVQSEAIRIGRYRVLETLGRGGMGVVYSAYDDKLGREVAIKLLHRGSENEAHRARLLREAQLLAKLSHPNVIQVYEVGEHDDKVFVAMELVRGRSLGELRSPPDGTLSWRALVEVFVQAGRGLAAAHEAGLVHRDFKPDNALLGDDGRVRVLDFGLARWVEGEATPTASTLPKGVGTSSDGNFTVTHVGAVVGTPAYMSPEQWRAETFTALSDQFSFCVALWEKLYGARPFSGTTIQGLAASIALGRIVEPATRTSVPSWLQRALRRGVATEPADRFGSMDELLDAISPTRRRRRNRIIGGSVVSVLVIAGAVATGAQAGPSPCDELDDRVSGVWNETVAARVGDGFRASGSAVAEDSLRAVRASFSSYGTQWTDTRKRACEDSAERGGEADEYYAHQLMCLGQRLEDLQHLVATFETADRAVVENAVLTVTELTPLSACEDATRLAAVHGTSGADPKVLAAIDRGTSRAQARYSLAKFQGARELATAAAEQARELGDASREGRALLLMSKASAKLGEVERAATELSTAITLERRVNDEVSLIDALLWRTELSAGYGNQLDAGQRAVEELSALLAKRDAPLQRAHLEQARGSLEKRLGNYDRAVAHAEAALLTREEELGPRDVLVGTTLNNLGAALMHSNRYDEAIAAFERAQSILENVLGADHPKVASALFNRASVLLHVGRASGRYAEAAAEVEPLMRRALQIKTERNGPSHVSTATSRHNLGEALRAQGKLDEARDMFARAAEIKRAAGVTRSLATSLSDLGRTELQRDNVAAAIEHLEEARSLRADQDGVSPEDSAQSAFDLGRALQARGGASDAADAAQLAREALAGFSAAGDAYAHELAAVEAWVASLPD